MKRLLFALVLTAVACTATTAQAQQPADEIVSPSPTQEMWFYLHELRRYDDPQIAIRRREELKAEQRRLRMASLKWFGYSASRPVANPVPFMGVASPSWVGNGRDPYQWVGSGLYRSAVRVEVDATRR